MDGEGKGEGEGEGEGRHEHEHEHEHEHLTVWLLLWANVRRDRIRWSGVWS